MKRVFTFGCSLTSYEWATWADILCLHYCQEGYETHNYGSSGMGNEHVLQALVAADLKYTFTDDDIICVLWSSWLREDRIWADRNWGKNGSILTSRGQPFQDFANEYFSLENYIMKNVTAIHTANKAYNINYQSTICPNETEWNTQTNDTLLKAFSELPEYIDTYSPEQVTTDVQRDILESTPILNKVDGHPTPQLHNIFLKNHVLPALGIDRLHPTANAWAVKWHGVIHQIEARLKLKDGVEWDHKEECLTQKRKETSPYMKEWEDLWDFKSIHTGLEQGVHNMLLRFKEVK